MTTLQKIFFLKEKPQATWSPGVVLYFFGAEGGDKLVADPVSVKPTVRTCIQVPVMYAGTATTIVVAMMLGVQALPSPSCSLAGE